VRAVLLGVALGCGVALGADPKRGETLYLSRCGACHTIDENGAGTQHRGLFARKAGTQPGFDYSEALKASGIVWTEKTVDRWLTNPTAFVPGNKMVVQLANQPVDRADLIAYLKTATKKK
jgi:cytochrome c